MPGPRDTLSFGSILGGDTDAGLTGEGHQRVGDTDPLVVGERHGPLGVFVCHGDFSKPDRIG